MIFGAVIDPEMGDEVRVTVIATGFERSGVPRRALERLNSRTERLTPKPAHYIRADVKLGGETRPLSQPTNYGSDDLDIPTFLRNRK